MHHLLLKYGNLLLGIVLHLCRSKQCRGLFINGKYNLNIKGVF